MSELSPMVQMVDHTCILCLGGDTSNGLFEGHVQIKSLSPVRIVQIRDQTFQSFIGSDFMWLQEHHPFA